MAKKMDMMAIVKLAGAGAAGGAVGGLLETKVFPKLGANMKPTIKHAIGIVAGGVVGGVLGVKNPMMQHAGAGMAGYFGGRLINEMMGGREALRTPEADAGVEGPYDMIDGPDEEVSFAEDISAVTGGPDTPQVLGGGPDTPSVMGSYNEYGEEDY